MQDAPKTNTYNEEGRILQIEYAIKNVSQAGTMLGYVCTDGVLLIGFKKSINIHNLEKLYKISDNIYACIAGIYADALQLIAYLRLKSEEFKFDFDMEISVHGLANELGMLKQSFTMSKGTRPFGVCVLLVGLEDDNYVLYSVLPSGSVMKWTAICYGEDEAVINSNLINNLGTEKYTVEEATREVINILKKHKEIKDDKMDLIEVLQFKKDSKKFLTSEQIKSYL